MKSDKREVHLELLLGKVVHDSNGKKVGRVEEIRAEQRGDEWVIDKYLTGSAALLERLSGWLLPAKILRSLGGRRSARSYAVPWDKMELSDPEHPVVTCTRDELPPLEEQPAKGS